MKKVLSTLVLACLIAIPASYAADAQADLQAIAQKLTQKINDGDIVAMMQQLNLYKQAGLSYQPELALATPVECGYDEHMRTQVGMHVFDANYAMLFGKMQESMQTRNFIVSELLPRIPASAKLELTPPDQKLVAQLLRNPQDEAVRKQLHANMVAQFENALTVAKTDPQVMELLVEVMYGAVIQGLYVATTLALDTPVTPELAALFQEQLNRLQIVDDLIHGLKSEQMQKMLNQTERCGVVDALIKRLSAAEGKISPELIAEINAIVKAERAQYVKVCK